MERLKQNKDVSYCQLDERLVFLDTSKDRYFQIHHSLEKHFFDFIETGGKDATALLRLAKLNILVPDDGSPLVSPKLPRPAQSAFEGSGAGTALRAQLALDVFRSVIAMQWRLKHWQLDEILALFTPTAGQVTATQGRELSDQAAIAIAASLAFQRVRPFVPVAPRCLVDSLSLVAFLKKRGIRANLVFAVACDPFSAHAWAQYGDIVLNDTTGNVWNYTPIRVI